MSEDRQIKIKDRYCQLIIDLGYDYDGCESPESLKSLIDELLVYAKAAIECDDKKDIYWNNGKRYNILGELNEKNISNN